MLRAALCLLGLYSVVTVLFDLLPGVRVGRLGQVVGGKRVKKPRRTEPPY